jgi:hypothetical protein
MEEKQMRILLEAIQRATLANDMSLVNALTAAGLAMVNGTDSEGQEAWAVIQELVASKAKPR